jgi:predicted NodU family carbamoyl transferase
MLRSIARLLERTKARHLGLAGGVFANVKLNRLITEKLPIDKIFIFPAMGDEGMRPLLSAPARRADVLALAAPAAARRLFWPRLYKFD